MYKRQVLFGLAAIIGFAGYGSFSDLAIWAGWCLINAVLAEMCIRDRGISLVKNSKVARELVYIMPQFHAPLEAPAVTHIDVFPLAAFS